MEIEQPLILKLRSLKNIISKADFANKQLEVDKTYGFRFRANNEERTIIFGDILSSGEQQTLIMTVELLFFAPDESLVLIDEPEISCHMMWQMDFLTNLRDITKLRQLQCFIQLGNDCRFIHTSFLKNKNNHDLCLARCNNSTRLYQSCNNMTVLIIVLKMYSVQTAGI